MLDYLSFLKRAASVVPSERQMAWFDTEFYAMICLTVNTYTDREWGLGDEDPAIFNPVDLDCDQWVEAIKSAGMKGLVLVVKHHDGFCLWPSAYTEHCVKNSPYKNGKGDIVKEAAEACRRGGIKFGVYLSPWDRNSKYYGTPEYNDYYANQLTELLTNYGELFMVWQDGACGEGPNGKKQEYDFDRYNALIRKYQPNAVIFHDKGPDVRWCGNESGSHRAAEWAVVPSDLCPRAEEQFRGSLVDDPITGIYNGGQAIGAQSNIIGAKGLCFAGAEVDMSIRPGWFYHEKEEPHSLERLFNTYLHTVGGNTCFNLNVPPMRNGLFDPRDIARLKELGDAIRSAFGKEIPCSYEKIADTPDGRCVYEIRLAEPAAVHYAVLAEDIRKGQRVENFEIRTGIESAYRGTVIGHKTICDLSMKDPADRLYLVVTSARDTVNMRSIQLY